MNRWWFKNCQNSTCRILYQYAVFRFGFIIIYCNWVLVLCLDLWYIQKLLRSIVNPFSKLLFFRNSMKKPSDFQFPNSLISFLLLLTLCFQSHCQDLVTYPNDTISSFPDPDSSHLRGLSLDVFHIHLIAERHTGLIN